MPDREIDQLSRVLGGIENELKSISRIQSEDRLAGAQYRTDFRAEIKEMATHFQEVQADVQSVQSDMRTAAEKIAEMHPMVVNHEQRFLMSKGAANFAIVLGKLAHIISAMIGGVFVLLVQKWIGK
jgi:chromosome segregation ATPase